MWATLLLGLCLTQHAGADTIMGFEGRTYEPGSGLPLNYRLFVPEGYSPSASYPLVLYLHGVGQRGTENEKQITDVLGDCRCNCMPLRFAGAEFQAIAPSFVLAPQCPPSAQWVDVAFETGSYSIDAVPESAALRSVRGIIDELAAEFSIDRDRLYATGLSMGGYGVWDIVLRNPDLFAAAVPVCGGGDPSRAGTVADMGFWIFHGDQDAVVPVAASREMASALDAAGADVRFTEVPGEGHFSWRATCDEPELASWLLSHTHGGTRTERARVFSVNKSRLGPEDIIDISGRLIVRGRASAGVRLVCIGSQSRALVSIR